MSAIQDRALASAQDALKSRYAAHFTEGRQLSAEHAAEHAAAPAHTATPDTTARSIS